MKTALACIFTFVLTILSVWLILIYTGQLDVRKIGENEEQSTAIVREAKLKEEPTLVLKGQNGQTQQLTLYNTKNEAEENIQTRVVTLRSIVNDILDMPLAVVSENSSNLYVMKQDGSFEEVKGTTIEILLPGRVVFCVENDGARYYSAIVNQY